jgi:hypothetical protein
MRRTGSPLTHRGMGHYAAPRRLQPYMTRDGLGLGAYDPRRGRLSSTIGRDDETMSAFTPPA